jgi:phosphonate transport system permease protein
MFAARRRFAVRSRPRAPETPDMANSLASSGSLTPPRELKRSVFSIAGWAAAALLLMWAWEGADMRPGDLFAEGGNMASFMQGFFPPDFTQWELYLREMIVTIKIAIWGTALSVVTAVPFGLLSSDNIAPWWVVQPVRRLMDTFRAINEMVFAMLFVAAVGLGPFAGVLAIWIHTVGVLAKLMSEAVEAIDPQPIEGIRATGGTRMHEVVFGVIPQVLPLWISFSLYRFESNVRSATVLGIVGAGGIGMVLWELIRGFMYAETAAVLVVVIISVTVLDLLSQRLRKLVI